VKAECFESTRGDPINDFRETKVDARVGGRGLYFTRWSSFWGGASELDKTYDNCKSGIAPLGNTTSVNEREDVGAMASIRNKKSFGRKAFARQPRMHLRGCLGRGDSRGGENPRATNNS